MKTMMMVGALIAATMVPVAAAATEGTSCSVTYGFAWSDSNTCTFSCFAGGKVTYSASSSKGAVSVTVACGGKSGTCETPEAATCDGDFVADSTGEGTCEIAGATWKIDEGTASCAGLPPGDDGGGIVDPCVVSVLGSCIPDATQLVPEDVGEPARPRCPDSAGAEADDGADLATGGSIEAQPPDACA